jgi:hypothetical protein
MYWIYAGSTEEEALRKAQKNLDLVNAKFIEICGDPWGNLQRLNANPVIEGNIYYYGFAKPPSQFNYSATYDLETEFSQEWFV